jgi:hypothetical protein
MLYDMGWGNIIPRWGGKNGKGAICPDVCLGGLNWGLIIWTSWMRLPHELTRSAYSYDMKIVNYNCIWKWIGKRS